MNIISKNNKIFKYESVWRSDINTKTTDSNGILFPYPSEHKKWLDINVFLHKLEAVESFLSSNKNYHIESDKNCLLCSEKKITNGLYHINNIYWEDGLKHYIEKHSIKPTDQFIKLINDFLMPKKNNYIKLNNNMRTKQIDKIKYVILDKNQSHIIDALLKHGGYNKKYYDKKNHKVYRYSEHSGLLDFNNTQHDVDKIIVSGKTNRVDKGDEEIFLPQNTKNASDYEYIFHTHPPTPKPGGRAKDGILYEIPSINDIFHFIDHFNSGKTNGSIVFAPEGLYNIRKKSYNKKYIDIDEDKLYEELKELYSMIQEPFIDLYGINFNSYFFYTRIAQDKTIVENINEVLNKYDLHVDYYPRTKDMKGSWIIDTIYLPIIS